MTDDIDLTSTIVRVCMTPAEIEVWLGELPAGEAARIIPTTYDATTGLLETFDVGRTAKLEAALKAADKVECFNCASELMMNYSCGDEAHENYHKLRAEVDE